MTANGAGRRLPGLAWLAHERGLSPGQMLTMALAVVPAFVLCLPRGPQGVLLVLSSGALFLAVAAAFVLVPWGRVPWAVHSVPPLAYLVAVALLRAGTGQEGSALAVLVLLPLVWVALVGDRFGLGLVIAGSALVLLTPVVTASGPVPSVEWRRALLYFVVSPLVGVAIQRLVVGMRTSAERFARLQASSEAIVRSVGDGLVVLDARGRVVEVNDTALRLLRRERPDVLGRTVPEVAGEVRPLRGASAHRLPAGSDADPHGARQGEYVVGRPDGTTIPLRVTDAPLEPADPGRGRVLAFRDIGEALRARRLSRARSVVTTAIAEASDEQEMLERIAGGLGEVLDAGVVIFWDVVPAAGPGDSAGLDLRALWEDPGHHRPEFARRTRELSDAAGLPGVVLATGRAEWITEFSQADPVRFPRAAAGAADGLRTSIALPLGSGEPLGVVELDFGHLESPDNLTRDLLVALAARIGDVLRRDRTEAEAARLKDEFTALVSHELRTPLTSISGYVELLDDELGPDPLPRRFLEVIGRNTARLRRLVEDLLFVARVDAGRLSLTFGDCDLPALVDAAVATARPSADRGGLTLATRVDGAVVVRGDADRLGQVLDNLLSNAVKFTPPGRDVTVRLRSLEDDPIARRAVLEVVDTGMGISESDQQRLFGRFVRSAEAEAASIPGVGLGLVISRAIVEAHGGTITLSSTPGLGTTFRVELPLAAPDHRAVESTGDRGARGG